MSEPIPLRPHTVDVDAEISRTTKKSGIVLLSLFSLGAGLLLRVLAHTLATSTEAMSSGVSVTRTDNFAEKLYIDIGMLLLVFGLALLFLCIVRASRSSGSA